MLILWATASQAADRPLSPRIDTGFKLGTERGIATTEIWIPVKQAQDRVLYGDMRLSEDDHDNFEGNLGGGYRHIYGNAVFGAHAWIDRRKTARGSGFNQATVGVEALGQNIDARLNGYIPLSGSKTYTTPNTGRDEPYLAGSGVFYDTAGTLVEEPQGGFDLELGYRLPIFQDTIDSIRIYGGGYHFGGDETPDITGWRTRLSADVTDWLQIGARFQKDAERGSQGFVEATVRFPGKASFRKEGLRARLDESPERDIDIVTGSAMKDSGIAKPFLNESGDPLRVLHVDNTNSRSGNGTKDNPYSTLKAAEAVLKSNDVIYVHRGDGTSAGQDLGIVIDVPNVKLIGAGVDLVFENGEVGAAMAGASSGTVLQAASAAPVITNTTLFNGSYEPSGSAVVVTAADALVAGITAAGASRHGIYATADAENLGSIGILGVTASGNDGRGIWLNARNGGNFEDVYITDSESIDNIRLEGVFVDARSGATIGHLVMDGVTSDNNIGGGNATGVSVRVDGSTASIATVAMTDITSRNNIARGIAFTFVNGGLIGQVELRGAEVAGNTQQGVLVQGTTGGRLSSIDMEDITVTGSAAEGVYLQANGVGSEIGAATLSNVSSNSNTGATGRGFYIQAVNSGHIGPLTLGDMTATGNAQAGLQLQSSSSSQVDGMTLRDSSFTANGGPGLYLLGQTAGVLSALIEGTTTTGNTQNGIYVDDDTVSAFTVDLGGGTLGGAGGNRIFGNTGTELRVDLDGGQLKAENNWWGVGTGLAGGETTLEAASTVDADPFLAVDPGP